MKVSNNIYKSMFFCLLAIGLTGCSSDDGGSVSKNLFSLWHNVDTNSPLDLRAGSLGVEFPFNAFFPGGEQCICDMTMIGTQTSGSWVLNSCFYVFNSGASDPGCNALNDTGTYTNASSILTITYSAGNASTYE